MHGRLNLYLEGAALSSYRCSRWALCTIKHQSFQTEQSGVVFVVLIRTRFNWIHFPHLLAGSVELRLWRFCLLFASSRVVVCKMCFTSLSTLFWIDETVHCLSLVSFFWPLNLIFGIPCQLLRDVTGRGLYLGSCSYVEISVLGTHSACRSKAFEGVFSIYRFVSLTSHQWFSYTDMRSNMGALKWNELYCYCTLFKDTRTPPVIGQHRNMSSEKVEPL